mmetsp:Transcript_72503/g.151333  ORF Transcript_72503/g.151333 Transcript_72503/m.151333 type:complete len:85 (+) Transcript_72503:1089-1343(+)
MYRAHMVGRSRFAAKPVILSIFGFVIINRASFYCFVCLPSSLPSSSLRHPICSCAACATCQSCKVGTAQGSTANCVVGNHIAGK